MSNFTQTGSSASAPLPASKPRILVVEDEGLIAHDIGRTLQELGYHVAGLASSGTEALALASQMETDLVLMDIRIRGDWGGIEVAERLWQQFQLPVIYLTAYTDTLTLDRAKVTEPFGYIVKPFSAGDIKVSVEIALRRHRPQLKTEERETWLTAVLRSIGDATIVTDADGNITFLNAVAEQVLGVTEAEACGRKLDSNAEPGRRNTCAGGTRGHRSRPGNSFFHRPLSAPRWR